MRSFALLLCLAPLTAAFAQDAQPTRLDEVLVTAEGAAYPAGLAERGVQGTTILAAELNADGKLKNAAVQQSSRSKELDGAALEVAAWLKYAAKPDRAAIQVLLPVRFNRDSVRSLSSKTCADFNTDLGYFKRTFPESAAIDMPSFDMTVGVLTALLKPGELLDFARRGKAVRQEIIDVCTESPERKYLEVAAAAARKK